MYYYIQDENENILLFDPSDKNRLQNTITNFMPQYKGYEILETETEIVTFENKNYFIDDEEYIELAKNKREEEFLKEFFKVTLSETIAPDGYAYYRRQPKGYQSAVESMNVLFNINTANTAAGNPGIPAGLIIFYQEPDFYDPSQCTEEWLVQHQIVMPAMTGTEFVQLYSVFMTAWNTSEHERQVKEAANAAPAEQE